MSSVYQTQCFVLRSFVFGESNKTLILLTENFGVIKITAQGIRKVQSKLQPLIQDFSFSEVAMILGKQGWKLTNAKIIKNFYYLLEKEKIEVLAKIFGLIFRLIPEEEPHSEIFEIVKKTTSFMEKISVEKKILTYVELISVLKILYQLGYVGENLDLQKYLKEDLNLEFFVNFERDQKKCLQVINLAIRESHL